MILKNSTDSKYIDLLTRSVVYMLHTVKVTDSREQSETNIATNNFYLFVNSIPPFSFFLFPFFFFT